MSDAGKNAKRAAKQALADKYTRLAKVCRSRPRKKRLLHHAASYRWQATELLRG